MAEVNLGRVGFVNKGTYSSSITYKINDVVKYQDGIYVATASTTGNLPTDTDYWQVWIDTDKIDRPTKVSTDVISVNGTELTLSSPTMGTDYYIQRIDGEYSLTDTKDDDTIGGFHYSLTPDTETETGNKTCDDIAEISGINSYSIWTKWFRPICEPEGMVYIGGRWYDIYLCNSEHITNGTSYSGGTIVAGDTTNGRAIPKIPTEYGGDGSTTYGQFSWWEAAEIAKSHSKTLISYEEFCGIAYGVNEGKSSSDDGYETIAGAIEHYPNLTSKYGIEQATGVQWIWGADINADADSPSWQSVAGGRGYIYANSDELNSGILGGRRDSGVYAGSRASYWSSYVWSSGWGFGSRFACNHMEIS